MDSAILKVIRPLLVTSLPPQMALHFLPPHLPIARRVAYPRHHPCVTGHTAFISPLRTFPAQGSSRSHCVFMVTVASSIPVAGNPEGDQPRVGKLNLVDLAGSERAGKTGAQVRWRQGAGNTGSRPTVQSTR